jgi:predicted permease
MFNCGTFTNITSFGGLVAFMYYGEAGYALSALFKLFEPVIYFSIGFPLAKLYSDESATGSTTKLRIDVGALARDRVVMLPLLGIAAGAILNWSGVVRPAVLGQLMSPLVMVSTAIMLSPSGPTCGLPPSAPTAARSLGSWR